MSVLISNQNGNFTTAGTWSLVDSTSYLDSEAGTTASTTSFVYSSTFTPGAITVDGIAVKVGALTSSAGTVTIELFNNTDTVTVANTVINKADIANTNANGTYNRGWYFFKFSGSQTLIAGKAYKVGLKTSVAGTVSLYRDATAGNWSRCLRTTSTQAPASGDQLHIIGEKTGAGTGNNFTVTMDNTATTSFGPTVSGGPPQGITVGTGGTLTYGTTSSTNYYLKFKGILGIFDGGTVNVGTIGTPIPSSSTAVMEMDSVLNVDSGISVFDGGTFKAYGNPAFTSTFKTLLTSNVSAAGTVLALVSTSGWANNDQVCIASTSQTATECEMRTISTVDSSTQVTLSAGVTNAHSGTSPTQAEVGNLTRNVKIRGIGTNAPNIASTLQGYIVTTAFASVTFRYTELYYLGSATASKRGIDVAVTGSGVFDMQYCSMHDGWITSSRGINISAVTGSTITVSNNIFYNINDSHINNAATTGVQVFDNNLFILNVGLVNMVNYVDAGITFTNNILIGAAFIALSIIENTALLGIISGNILHSNGNIALNLSAIGGTISNTIVWRNNGLNGTLRTGALLSNVVMDGITAFGNSTNTVLLSVVSAPVIGCIVKNMVSNGDTTFPTTNGWQFGANVSAIFENCDFSTVSGIKTAHTNDFNVSTAGYLIQINCYNCKFGAATEIASQSNMATGSFITSQKHDGTAGNHKCWMPEGTVSLDTVIFNTVSPSARLTPLTASAKLASAPKTYGFYQKVANGTALTPSINVRKSVVGDGAAYNGNQPRLIVRKNVAAGISADTVLATGVSANGTWEMLTGTTVTVTDDTILEFIVDCDGTAGWVNIDDFNSDGLQYWSNGVAFAGPVLGVNRINNLSKILFI